MATKIKPTTKNSPAIRTGRAKNNGPAEQYEKNGTGVEAQRKAVGHGTRDPNTMRADEVGPSTVPMRVSIGNIDSSPKTSGIEVRGSGAATKGRMARGPMA
jgi:hypothetical protein